MQNRIFKLLQYRDRNLPKTPRMLPIFVSKPTNHHNNVHSPKTHRSEADKS